MYYLGELVVSNYIPETIEPGMMFMNTLNPGTDKARIELWQVKKSFSQAGFNKIDDVFDKYGYPVHLMVIDPNDGWVLARHEQIAWFDEGDNVDEYRDIELKDINKIFQEHDGFIEIEVDELDENYEAINPILHEGKVIIRAF